MSATNRGRERNDRDFYETPQDCILNFLSHYKLKNGIILDPGSGSGAFPKAIRKVGYTNQIDACDIDDMVLSIEEADNKHLVNFMDFNSDYAYNTIIGNPPYNLAEEFIRKSFELVDSTDFEIIFLLRLNFLESIKRHDFWQEFPVNQLYVLSKRPSFTGKGTDATSYAYFVFRNSGQQSIHVI